MGRITTAAKAKTAVGLVLTAAAIGLGVAPAQVGVKGDPKAGETFFEEKVRPILKTSCLPCHSGPEASGKFDLTKRDAILKGGASGPSIDPKSPHVSLFLKAVRYEGRQMPPQGKLPKAQIDVLTRWVEMGLPMPEEKPGAEEPAHHGPPQVNAETKKFWAFQPVKRPAAPAVKNAAWAKTPIDRFVLAKLEANGLKPSPQASRVSLIRRAYYDMTGLPPSPAEVQAFLADASPKAWEKVVDRLLASPHYGERWGRHWLDLVRYAETNSFERDGDKPFVWRYRDYVIRSFNADKPYDRFLTEQLAGDELPTVTPETMIATGYYRLGAWDDEPADPEQALYDDLDDIVNTTGQTFLGLTVGCARCHDHKIDPMPARDYYRMVAFFRNVNRFGVRSGESIAANSLRSISPAADQKRFESENAAYRAKLAEIDRAIRVVEDEFVPTLKGGERDDFRYEQNRLHIAHKHVGDTITAERYAEYERLTKEKAALRAAPPKGLEMALCVTESSPTPEKTFVLARGSAHAPTDEVTPGFPAVLSPPEPKIAPAAPGAKTTGRRRAFAEWVASPANPLTARVMANRIWQYHFGRGIVRSTSNFGFLGTPPTHPELLDWLADEFVKGQWKMKPLHRTILLSSTYRMSSQANKAALEKDPENEMFWRFDMRRLEAEEIRDSLLAANGTLNPKLYGPSVKVKLPREVLAGQSVPGQGWEESPAEEQTRRSVYVKVKRSLAVPIFASFDAADTDATCPVRFATTQPTQALGMMNSAFVNQQAQTLADLARKKVGTADPAAQVRFVLWRTLQRPPKADEVARGVKLIADLRAEDGKSADAALQGFCLVALNLNEFVYLD